MEDKIDLRWRKSSYSGNGGGKSIEAPADWRDLVRDSQDRAGTVLRFSPAAWREFADQVKRSLGLGPALRVPHRFAAVSLCRSERGVHPCAPRHPIVQCERPCVFGEAKTGLRGRLEPAVVSSAGPGFPRGRFRI